MRKLIFIKSCPRCRGCGETDCIYCNGTGYDFNDGGQCDYCDGTGEMECPVCGGEGVIEVTNEDGEDSDEEDDD